VTGTTPYSCRSAAPHIAAAQAMHRQPGTVEVDDWSGWPGGDSDSVGARRGTHPDSRRQTQDLNASLTFSTACLTFELL